MGYHGNKRKGSKGGKGGGKGKKGSKGSGKKPDTWNTGGNDGPPSKRLKPTGALPAHAVVISSNSPSLCPKATREAIQLLKDAVEVVRPGSAQSQDSAAQAASEDKPKSLDDELEAELRELRGDDAAKPGVKRPRISLYGEVSRGVAVLSCPNGVDVDFPLPSLLVKSVFQARTTGPDKDRAVRYVVRLAPLDYVCPPHLKNFRATAEAALPKAFAGVAEGTSWYIAFNSRAMSTITQKDVLVVLKEILGPLKLDMSVSDAEYTIVIEVNPSLCGFSVLQHYEQTFFECNLQKACKAIAASDDEDDFDDEDEEDEEEIDPSTAEIAACTAEVEPSAAGVAALAEVDSSAGEMVHCAAEVRPSSSGADCAAEVALCLAKDVPCAAEEVPAEDRR